MINPEPEQFYKALATNQLMESALACFNNKRMRAMIENLRRHRGWTRYKLAKKAELRSTQTLYTYLNGQTSMRLDNLRKVLRCLLNKDGS